MRFRIWICAALVAGVLVVAPAVASAQPPQGLDLTVEGIGSVSAPIQIILLLTLLTFVPAILVTMTSFTRIVIIFHFMRQVLGTQEVPSNQILLGLALFLTMFIMAPVAERVNEVSVEPALSGEIELSEAITRAGPPVRTFMLRQTRETDLALFLELGQVPVPATREETPMRVVIPAYVISELKTGFQMGFFLFIPFILIDLVVSTTLLSMGMMQLPPAMISMPFKVMLFVMIDGWSLLVGSVVRSFL